MNNQILSMIFSVHCRNFQKAQIFSFDQLFETGESYDLVK